MWVLGEYSWGCFRVRYLSLGDKSMIIIIQKNTNTKQPTKIWAKFLGLLLSLHVDD